MPFKHAEAERVPLPAIFIEAVMVAHREIGRDAAFIHYPLKTGMEAVGLRLILHSVGFRIVAAKQHKLRFQVSRQGEGFPQPLVTVALVVLVQMHIRQVSKPQFHIRRLLFLRTPA